MTVRGWGLGTDHDLDLDAAGRLVEISGDDATYQEIALHLNDVLPQLYLWQLAGVHDAVVVEIDSRANAWGCGAGR